MIKKYFLKKNDAMNQNKKRITLTNKIEISKNLLFYITALSMTIYIIWRIFFTIPFSYGVMSLIFGILLVVSETIAFIEALEQYFRISNSEEPELPEIPDKWYPNVDVFIATHNESSELLFKTINACTYLDYPDKNKVHVFVCDDGNRPEIEALAKELHVGYFGLANNKLAKAGNLNNALSKTCSPLVATFDADMIPRRDFLMKTVPYFFLPNVSKNQNGQWQKRTESEQDKSYKIGFIQTPQSFYNPDLFQYNLYAENRFPNEQDYFFREINVARNSANAPIYAGSNTLISRVALEEVGGIAIGTITEDFETGLKIQKSGYSTYAVSDVLAHGLAPITIKSLISQRERWGRGCVQSLKRIKILSDKELSKSAKISYGICFVYWWTFFRRLIYICSPVLFTIFHLRIVDCSFWEVIVLWLPSYLLYNKTLRALSGNIRNQHLSNVIDTIIFPYLIIPVFLETIGVRQNKFVVTKKDRNTGEQEHTTLYAIPHIVLLFASIFAFGMCLHQTLVTSTVYNIIIMYWLVINAKNLILAIMFMVGRQNYRQSERFYVNLPLKIEYAGKIFNAHTDDVSETGLCMVLDRPEYLPDKESFKLTVFNEFYSSEMHGKIVYIEQKGDKWKYSVMITEIDEHNKREYFQLVFDRDHTLPMELSRSTSIYDDFKLNIDKRIQTAEIRIRRLPRIELNMHIACGDTPIGIIKNFNYQYIVILSDYARLLYGKNVVFELDGNVCLQLTRVKSANTDECLYFVENWGELILDRNFDDVLNSWIEESKLPNKRIHKITLDFPNSDENIDLEEIDEDRYVLVAAAIE